MTWATHAIEQLKLGQTVTLRPRGQSMAGRINSGDTVTIVPLEHDPQVDDVVLVRCYGSDYLHLVKARQADRYLIGNNKGHINGWVHRKAIFGIVQS